MEHFLGQPEKTVSEKMRPYRIGFVPFQNLFSKAEMSSSDSAQKLSQREAGGDMIFATEG